MSVFQQPRPTPRIWPVKNPYDRPTVSLRVQVPEPNPGNPNAWRWGSLYGVAVGYEYVYSERDLRRAVLVYGRAADVLLKPTRYPRFRIIARELFTGRLLAEHIWCWEPIAGDYVPPTEPLIVWPDVHALPAEVVRGALATHQPVGSAHADHMGH